MPKEVYRDTGLAFGTHHGKLTLFTLRSTEVDFDAIGAVGRLVSNDTDGSSGTVVFASPLFRTEGWSYLLVVLAGGATNRWNPGDAFTLYIGTVAKARISSTEICKKSGFAYPKDTLVDGEHPDETDLPQSTMTTGRR